MTEQEVIHAAENGGGEDVAVVMFDSSKEIGVSFQNGGLRHAFRVSLDSLVQEEVSRRVRHLIFMKEIA